MQFNIWIEERDDFEDAKKTALTALFPSLDQKQAEDNMDLPIETLDSSIIHQMLQSGEIEGRLNGRNPKQFLKSRKGITVNDFIKWLTSNEL